MTSVTAVLEHVRRLNRPVVEGRVSGLVGLAVEVSGLPAAVGEHCTLFMRGGPVPAQVVGFREDRALVMPFHWLEGVAPGSPVLAEGHQLAVTVGPQLLGRVVDALARPIDGGPPVDGTPRLLSGEQHSPLARRPITQPLETRVAAIDALLTCGKGQRVGIFAGSGVGKSTLLGLVARKAQADVNVIALIGERGREVKAFIEEVLGPEGMKKSIVVVATGDAPPLMRLVGPATAVTIAEGFRDQGKDVLLVMDSVTRFAHAAREVGLAAGEPPTLRGFPPSFFARLPRIVERLGHWQVGSITGLFTVLVEGDDMNEPVADTLRGLLDGHIVLSRSLFARGRFPAIDPLLSISRLMDKVATPAHREQARDVRAMLAVLEENRDLVQVGAYKRGTDPVLDRALARVEALDKLLYPGTDERSLPDTLMRMAQVVR